MVLDLLLVDKVASAGQAAPDLVLRSLFEEVVVQVKQPFPRSPVSKTKPAAARAAASEAHGFSPAKSLHKNEVRYFNNDGA